MKNHIETKPKKEYKKMYRSEWKIDPQLKSILCHSYYLNYNVAHTCLSLLLKLNNNKKLTVWPITTNFSDIVGKKILTP